METRGREWIRIFAVLLISLLLFSGSRVFAQEGTQGKIVVTVEDTTGAVVPGAARACPVRS